MAKQPTKPKLSKQPQALQNAKQAIIKGSEAEDDPGKAKAFYEAESARVAVDDRVQKLALRGRWSNWIIGWITALVVFNSLMITLVGFEVWKFEEWFGVAVTIEMFLQIIGLGYVAAKYLFSD